MTTFNLSNINPDQSDLLAQLEAFLSQQSSWSGNYHSQTGQGILSAMSAIGAYSQASIRRAFQDSFPETVLSDTASFAIASMLGVRLVRKLPAAVTANLTASETPQILPPYTIFQGGGGYFFNREAVFIQAGQTVQVTLNEGRVVRYQLAGTDQPYSMFVSTENAFTVSDEDVSITLNNTPMERTTGGLWTLLDQLGFSDSTLPDGKLMVQFGSNTYGKIPGTNDQLLITYVITLGADGNGMNTDARTITLPDYLNIRGEFVGVPAGGAAEREALVYKNVAAPTFGAFDSAITRQQYLTMALKYPGVIDAIPYAQREVNPNALEWMNLIRITLLTSGVWDAVSKQRFIDYMQKKTAYAPRFFLVDPTPAPVNIKATLYCYNWANPTESQALAQANLEALFAPQIGLLAKDLYLGDLIMAIQSAAGVEYCTLETPTTDVIISGQPVPPPSLSVIPSGGLFGPGDYTYSIAAATALGVITTRSSSTQHISSGAINGIQVEWDAIYNATEYYVYRSDLTTGGVPRYIATVSASLTVDGRVSYIDLGTGTPGDVPPPQNTTPTQYVTLGTLDLTAKYSTRSTR